MDTSVICIYDNSPSRTRTYDSAVNSRVLYRLSYRGISYQNHLTDYLSYYIRFLLFVKHFFQILIFYFSAAYLFPSTICIIACSIWNVKHFFQIVSRIVFKLFLLCLSLYSSSSSTATATLETALTIATITATTITSPIRTISKGNRFVSCCVLAC